MFPIRVDVQVSEVLSVPLIEEVECALERMGIDDRATIFRDIRTYHVGLIALGELAQESGVGQLVLTHMLPSLDPPIANLVFGTPLQEIYTGELLVAEDGSRVSLAVE